MALAMSSGTSGATTPEALRHSLLLLNAANMYFQSFGAVSIVEIPVVDYSEVLEGDQQTADGNEIADDANRGDVGISGDEEDCADAGDSYFHGLPAAEDPVGGEGTTGGPRARRAPRVGRPA
jgi:hypothetical protein